ncbi:Subtilisin-like protease, fibronectin type-III domain [Dillenia turbinata]|uniref:Subtilisin-like protease, fibronectin type-III domain n=1 Tax=Dillenia turbinata TaxID=194707 RepID=A0AAN8WDB1_9MAGN
MLQIFLPMPSDFVSNSSRMRNLHPLPCLVLHLRREPSNADGWLEVDWALAMGLPFVGRNGKSRAASSPLSLVTRFGVEWPVPRKEVLFIFSGKMQGTAINTFDLNGTSYPLIWGGDAVNFSVGANSEIASYCWWGALSSTQVQGKIVLCDGVDEGSGILVANGVGAIWSYSFLNDVSFNWDIPTTIVSGEDGQRILDYIKTSENPIATILVGETPKDVMAPSVASFSSRGPSFITPDILKDGKPVMGVFPRTVTNVGSANSTYTATITSPALCIVKVEPSTLTFSALGEKQSFTVTVAGPKDVAVSNLPITSGAIVWSDGTYTDLLMDPTLCLQRSQISLALLRIRRVDMDLLDATKTTTDISSLLNLIKCVFPLSPVSLTCLATWTFELGSTNFGLSHWECSDSNKWSGWGGSGDRCGKKANPTELLWPAEANPIEVETDDFYVCLRSNHLDVCLPPAASGMDMVQSIEHVSLACYVHIVYMGERPHGGMAVASSHHVLLQNLLGRSYQYILHNAVASSTTLHQQRSHWSTVMGEVSVVLQLNCLMMKLRGFQLKTLQGLAVNNFNLNGTLYPLIWGGDAANFSAGASSELASYCSNGALSSTRVQGKIVLCDSVDEGSGILEAKAVGAIWSYSSADPFSWDFPATWISPEDGQKIFDYIKTSNYPIATILVSETPKDILAPMVADFSSRGPNPITPDILKPGLITPEQLLEVGSGSFIYCIEDGKPIMGVFSRTVTNVGSASSTYTASIIMPAVCTVKVEPSTLSFSATGEKKTFKVTVSGPKDVDVTNLPITSGAIIWTDGTYTVRTPIVVYTVLPGSNYGSNSMPAKKANFFGLSRNRNNRLGLFDRN